MPRPVYLALAAACLPAVLAATPAPRPSPSPAKPSPAAKASSTVRRWMRGMTLRDEVAQLIFIPFQGAPPNSQSREYRNFARLIREVKVGGLILTNASNGRVVRKAEPYALAAF